MLPCLMAAAPTSSLANNIYNVHVLNRSSLTPSHPPLLDELNHATTHTAPSSRCPLAAGRAGQRLSDGNWLLLYTTDNLVVNNNNPPDLLSVWRDCDCAVGWAVLDGADLSHVVAKSEAPLIAAEMPWEVEGHPDRAAAAAAVDGLRAEGKDVFTVYAAGGVGGGACGSIVESFRIRVEIEKPRSALRLR